MRPLLIRLAAVLIAIPTLVSGQRGTGNQRPNFEGIWNSATATPLERPRELKDKAFFTPEEAAKWARVFRAQSGACARAGPLRRHRHLQRVLSRVRHAAP